MVRRSRCGCRRQLLRCKFGLITHKEEWIAETTKDGGLHAVRSRRINALHPHAGQTWAKLQPHEILEVVAAQKLERLRTLQLFVLDNSVRETTVAQVRGHTLPDKHAICKLVQANGIQNQLVAVLGRRHRVDDQLLIDLRALAGQPGGGPFAGQHFFSFCDFHDAIPGGAPGELNPGLPAALLRAKELGVRNVTLDLDACCPGLNADVDATLRVLDARLAWARLHLGGSVFITVRDFVPASQNSKLLLLERIARRLAAAPPGERCAGLMVEDPSGGCFPSLFGACACSSRRLSSSLFSAVTRVNKRRRRAPACRVRRRRLVRRPHPGACSPKLWSRGGVRAGGAGVRRDGQCVPLAPLCHVVCSSHLQSGAASAARAPPRATPTA